MKLHERLPQAMLFVRGGNAGISHNPLETITKRTTPSCACRPLTRFARGPRERSRYERLPRTRQLDAWIDAHFDEQLRFLQALVQVPTDTPPGDNAPHAEKHRRTAGRRSATRPRNTPCRPRP
jgi:hypothetical protein